MAAFTDPNINFQAKELMREIEHSFYQRYLMANALGSAPTWAVNGGSFAAGSSLQDSSLWRVRHEAFGDMVAALDGLGFKFLQAVTPNDYEGDYAADLLGDTYAGDVTALWQAAISQNGPRRYIPSGASWTLQYGDHQAGDLVGPWLYEDMQAAFRAMRYTLIVVDNTFGLRNYVDRKPPVYYDGYQASPPAERGLYAMSDPYGGGEGWPEEPNPNHFRGWWGRQYYGAHDWSIQINDHNTQVQPGYPAAMADVGSLYYNPMQTLPSEEYDDKRLARRCLAKYYTSRIKFLNGKNIRACTSVTEFGRANIVDLPTALPHRLSAYAIVEKADWVFMQRPVVGRFPGNYAEQNGWDKEEDEVDFMPFSLPNITGADQLARIKEFDGTWSSASAYALAVDNSSFSISKYMGPSAATNDSPPVHGTEYGDAPADGVINEDSPDYDIGAIPWYGYQLAPVVFWVADWQWAYT